MSSTAALAINGDRASTRKIGRLGSCGDGAGFDAVSGIGRSSVRRVGRVTFEYRLLTALACAWGSCACYSDLRSQIHLKSQIPDCPIPSPAPRGEGQGGG